MSIIILQRVIFSISSYFLRSCRHFILRCLSFEVAAPPAQKRAGEKCQAKRALSSAVSSSFFTPARLFRNAATQARARHCARQTSRHARNGSATFQRVVYTPASREVRQPEGFLSATVVLNTFHPRDTELYLPSELHASSYSPYFSSWMLLLSLELKRLNTATQSPLQLHHRWMPISIDSFLKSAVTSFAQRPHALLLPCRADDLPFGVRPCQPFYLHSIEA